LLKNIKVGFTFLNLVNKQNLYNRLKKRKSLNRYDKFNISFYKKVQNGFLKLSNKQKKKYQLINSNLNIKDNEKLILSIIDRLIK
jgi:dTMP kinase